MAGNEEVAQWIAAKLQGDQHSKIKSITPLGSGYLEIKRRGMEPFKAAAIGVQDFVDRSDVVPLFEEHGKPEFVVNVPSKAIWKGSAITFVHNAPAAFGTMGELVRAAASEAPSGYRNKETEFFERAFRQHSAVRDVNRAYDRMFLLERGRGLPDISIVLIDAYDMSAEDIRHARDLYGRFDAGVKMTSYGSVTSAAREAAESMGAGAFTLKELMGRLNKP